MQLGFRLFSHYQLHALVSMCCGMLCGDVSVVLLTGKCVAVHNQGKAFHLHNANALG